MKVYSKSWLGLKFKNFHKISNEKLPGKKFYDDFYDKCFENYKEIANFPKSWLLEKEIDSKNLNDVIEEYKCKKVLSLASGLGVIEHNLKIINPELDIFCNDLSKNISWAFDNSLKVKHIDLEDYLDFDFDIIYVNGLDYALEDNEYLSFLKMVSELKSKIIMISCIVFPEDLSLKNKIGHFLKGLFGWQFWGILRSKKQHISFFEQSNLKPFKHNISSSNNTNIFLLKKKND